MDSNTSVRDERRFDRGIDGLEPDHVTPGQFAGMLRSATWRNGEHRLIAAVLQDAVETFHKCAFARTPQRREQFAEVHRWIVDQDDHSLFAFTTICEILDLDANCLREALLLWLEQNRKRPVSIGARFLDDPRRRVDRIAATG